EAGDAAGNWTTNGPSVYVSGSGNNPLNYMSSNLTTISGSYSSDGDAVDGSSTVPLRPTIRIIFDRNVTTDAIWPANQQCFSMQDSSGTSVPITVTKISNALNFEERQHVFITPQSDLTAGKTYKIVISGSLKANNGNTIGSNQIITFTVTGSSVAAITTNGPTITTGDAMVDPALGATVSQGKYATIVIPANALKGSGKITVKIDKVSSPPAPPADAKTASDVYEFKVGTESAYSFAAKVALTMDFDTAAIGADEVASLFYYNEEQGKWVNLGGEVSGSSITVQVDHFTKFAVFAVKKTAVVPVVPVIAVPAVTLNDIAGHWAEANINKLVAMGAVSGYTDGSFKPNANISRAEFVTVLVKAFKLEAKSGKVFDDTMNSWAKDYIATATAYGIASGYNDQVFGADDPITREQMVVMVIKAAQFTPASAEIAFADSDSISAWARESMATAINKGIIKGFPDNTIRPGDNASRAEAITVIANSLM
ncbi:MAG: S-layer homology domain-containing protein, partial [Syntrophomonas sp.]|nr:S-layer homology domain-containing protein [Syntrophomonas sp.]